MTDESRSRVPVGVALSLLLFLAGWLASGVALLACDENVRRSASREALCTTVGSEGSRIAIAVVPPTVVLAAAFAFRRPRWLLLLAAGLLVAQLAVLAVVLLRAV